jgi:hypothetical protein
MKFAIPKELLPVIMKELLMYKEGFINDTIEPRIIKPDSIGQFVAIGKLKKPSSHHGKLVNKFTVRTVFLTDELKVETSKTDLTYDELKLYRDCCNDVINKCK